MNRFTVFIRPPGYNPPSNWRMLYNQWLHYGFLLGFYSYKFYSEHDLEIL